MLNLMIVMMLLSAPDGPAATIHEVSLAHPSLMTVGREPLANVERAYDELRSIKARERAELVRQMSPSMQADIWAHHFLTTLVEHPEFTAEQQAVIQEALSLLTPELFEIDPSHPQWAEQVDKPLRALKERAKAAFADRAFAKAVFMQLGPDPEPGVEDRTKLSGSFFSSLRPRQTRAQSEGFPLCTCSRVSDWCNYDFWDADECVPSWCTWTPSGCGTLFNYRCDGFCRTISEPTCP